jgi:hypothetical protein
MGFDPETGQILDAEKFARWQREQQLRKEQELAAQPTLTVYEAFIKARTEIQEWIDADVNKPIVVSGAVDAIKEQPGILAVMQAYAGYGPVMLEKLEKHLTFIVDNRRQFYAAFAGKLPT